MLSTCCSVVVIPGLANPRSLALRHLVKLVHVVPKVLQQIDSHLNMIPLDGEAALFVSSVFSLRKIDGNLES